MPEAKTFRFKIDGHYTPSTIPMARLAEYMTDVAIIMGEQAKVHFVNVGIGSTVLRAKVEPEAAEKVRIRVNDARLGRPAPDAGDAVRRVNFRLREDGSRATFAEEIGERLGELLYFPGVEAEVPVPIPAFNQDGTLDGIVVRLGGRKDTVPVLIEGGPNVYRCVAQRFMAKRLAEHIFSSELRVKGSGRWTIDETGKWVLDRFSIYDFEVLDDEPLTSVVAALRAMPGGEWDKIANPWADVMALRDEPHGTN